MQRRNLLKVSVIGAFTLVEVGPHKYVYAFMVGTKQKHSWQGKVSF